MASRSTVMMKMMVYCGASVLSLSVATQWLAHRLSDQPALGRPILMLSGLSFYRPDKILFWWAHYGHQAPRLFDEGGAIVIVGQLFAGVMTFVAGALTVKRIAPITYGSARWATFAEAEQAGLFAPQGIMLGTTAGRYVRHNGPEHVLLVAPTRSGKGVGVVVPTLLSWTGSVVVHDLKGEQWTLTAGWRSGFSHCLLFDPTNILSARFNPLLEVRRGAFEVRDVQNIADILVDPEGGLERRGHWEKTSHSLLVGAILHILYSGEEKTLAAVCGLLSRVDRPFTATLEEMLQTRHLDDGGDLRVHPVVASCARELLDKSENERSGILSTAVSFLSLYKDPVVAAVTAGGDWRIADLIVPERPVSLYLVVPPSDISRTRPLIRLLLNQICRRLTEALPANSAPRLLLMLDEFPALGRLDFFETSLAFLAGYGIRALLVAQSMSQLTKVYGDNQAIGDNCGVRVAFAANDERTAKRLSETLGTATEQRAMRNFSGPRSALWLPNTSVSEQETARPLLTPGEIIQLPGDEALIQAPDLAPLRVRKLRYFEHAALRRRRLAPPELGAKGFQDLPPHRPHDWPIQPAPEAAPAGEGGACRTSRRRAPLQTAPTGEIGLYEQPAHDRGRCL